VVSLAGGWPYILGARMRRCKEVREHVLADRGRFRVVHPRSRDPKDPAPLKVKEVKVEGRRYVVCVNEDEVQKDRADREAIVAGLCEQLRAGDKSLVGNQGYRRFLKVEGSGHFAIDEAKFAEEARYDGTWVLRTSTELPAAEVALRFSAFSRQPGGPTPWSRRGRFAAQSASQSETDRVARLGVIYRSWR
jgi:hypothetical protein